MKQDNKRFIQIPDNAAFTERPEYIQAYFKLASMVRWSTEEVQLRYVNEAVTLKKGQAIVSIRDFDRKLGNDWSVKKTRLFFERMEQEGIIIIETKPKQGRRPSIITLTQIADLDTIAEARAAASGAHTGAHTNGLNTGVSEDEGHTQGHDTYIYYNQKESIGDTITLACNNVLRNKEYRDIIAKEFERYIRAEYGHMSGHWSQSQYENTMMRCLDRFERFGTWE